jgi:hypothetical protein
MMKKGMFHPGFYGDIINKAKKLNLPHLNH